jgi:hypothetical protein
MAKISLYAACTGQSNERIISFNYCNQYNEGINTNDNCYLTQKGAAIVSMRLIFSLPKRYDEISFSL